jgi:hypothetical protein
MSNVKLSDVVDVLFAEFQKINNTSLTGEKLTEQLEKTKTIIGISKQIVETAALGLEAQKQLPNMLHGAEIPKMLRIDK